MAFKDNAILRKGKVKAITCPLSVCNDTYDISSIENVIKMCPFCSGCFENRVNSKLSFKVLAWNFLNIFKFPFLYG